jgi:hypothetical protein
LIDTDVKFEDVNIDFRNDDDDDEGKEKRVVGYSIIQKKNLEKKQQIIFLLENMKKNHKNKHKISIYLMFVCV